MRGQEQVLSGCLMEAGQGQKEPRPELQTLQTCPEAVRHVREGVMSSSNQVVGIMVRSRFLGFFVPESKNT